MKKILLALFILSVVNAKNSNSQYSSPESVAYDSVGKRYLISNTNSTKIVQRDINGVVTDFVTVGSSIHGVTVYDNKVYVCNGTRIRGYDLSNASEIFNVNVAGSTFLNDLAIDDSGIMYVSDFTARRIYKVNTNNSDYWIYVAATTNQPNGVYVDAPRNRLLICCWGANAPIKSVNFSDSSITNIITTPYTNCDGISLDRNDNVYVSTWGIQSVARYDINFSNAPVIVASGLSNPADIYVNKVTDTLAVPNAGNSTVVFSLLSIPSGISPKNGSIPASFALYQNYPNPFNPKTVITYELRSNAGDQTSEVKLIVYNSSGKEVQTLVNERQNAGTYEVTFDAAGLSSGIYFYKLEAGEFSEVKKMMVLK